MFVYVTSIKLAQTDAAGRMFFGEVFRLCHEAYEEFLATNGLPLSEIINRRSFILPIVHAEANFLAPLAVSEQISVTIMLEKIGRASFSLNYELIKSDGSTANKVQTVHACISKKNSRSLSLPTEIKKILTRV